MGVNAFTVYQEITLQDGVDARVNNIVDFGPKIGQLKVPLQLANCRLPVSLAITRGSKPPTVHIIAVVLLSPVCCIHNPLSSPDNPAMIIAPRLAILRQSLVPCDAECRCPRHYAT